MGCGVSNLNSADYKNEDYSLFIYDALLNNDFHKLKLLANKGVDFNICYNRIPLIFYLLLKYDIDYKNFNKLTNIFIYNTQNYKIKFPYDYYLVDCYTKRFNVFIPEFISANKKIYMKKKIYFKINKGDSFTYTILRFLDYLKQHRIENGKNNISSLVNKVIKQKKYIKKLEKLDLDDFNLNCCVCLEKQKNMMFEPCNHLAICNDCCNQFTFENCPICRTKINKIKKIFI